MGLWWDAFPGWKHQQHLMVLQILCDALLKSVYHLLTKGEKEEGKGVLMPCLLEIFGHVRVTAGLQDLSSMLLTPLLWSQPPERCACLASFALTVQLSLACMDHSLLQTCEPLHRCTQTCLCVEDQTGLAFMLRGTFYQQLSSFFGPIIAFLLTWFISGGDECF